MNSPSLPIGWTGYAGCCRPPKSSPSGCASPSPNALTILALDIAEELVEARYTRRKRDRLHSINRKLERLRILLRLSHDLQALPHRQYEFAMRSLDEAGRMVGGWLKQQEA